MKEITNWLIMEWKAIPFEATWMFVLALLVSAGGFYRLVYFVSIGYAFSITAMSIAGLFLFSQQLDMLAILHCVALGVYGIRLGTFLSLRELKPSYRRELDAIQERNKDVSIGKYVGIWLGVSVLYVMMFSPGLFHLAFNTSALPTWKTALIVAGLAIATLGLFIEGLADHQKSAFKKDHPTDFCHVGLYKHMRCPNYFGEIVFWIGNWTAGIPFYGHTSHWAMSIVGLLCIILIMMGSTKRLEHKQDERYGDRESYQNYVKSTPVLFPFLPLYSLKSVKVYLE
jgi:steroid 5-alpha reductase family enzyme